MTVADAALTEKRREMMVKLLDPIVADNPLVFVKTVWPWGKAGTFLHNMREPRKWQCEELERLGDWVHRQIRNKIAGVPFEMYCRAFCSGHGTGKGAFWGMVRHWFKSTRLGCSIVDTANTEDQLRTRTWAESEKWFNAADNCDWFNWSTANLECLPTDWLVKELPPHITAAKYADRGQMYKVGKKDSWAGIHNEHGVMLGIDEASGVPDFISETSLGFFTDAENQWRIWFQFSQGRHNEGYFYEIKDNPLWTMRHLNAMEIEGTDKAFLRSIIEKNGGENSYEARVLVFGLFADETKDQFIKHSLVNGAMKRVWTPDHERAAKHEPIVMACDPSGGGEGADLAIIGKRRGFDMRSFPFIELPGLELPELEKAIVAEYKRTKPRPQFIVIDSTGLGLGVYQSVKKMLRKDRNVTVIGVNFGSSPDKSRPESKAWKDKRTELYARTREWLSEGFLPESKELKRDLTAPKKETLDGGKVKITSKREMKRKGLPSPDRGDVVAMTMEPTTVTSSKGDEDDRPSRPKDTGYDADPLNRRAA